MTIQPLTVELMDDSRRFAALRSEWTALQAASSADSPFLTWEWLNAWWTHLGAARRLAILAVHRGAELVAIAPLSASRARLPWIWQLEFLGTGLAGSDYLDIIVRKGEEAEAITAIAAFARSRNLALRLDHLSPDGVFARLAAPLIESGWTVHQANHGVCPFIRLAGHSWDSLLAASNRSTTRRRLRLLERDFTMRFERITDEPARKTVLDRLFAFHDARWQQRGTAFQGSAMRAFHHDATARMLPGALRLYALYLKDELAAAMYGFSCGGRFYFYQHGFDERFRQQSAGRAVLDLSIRAAIEEGLAEFDFLYGDEPYKASWTDVKHDLARLDLFPPHLGGRVHHRAVETERTLRTLARRVLSTHATQAN